MSRIKNFTRNLAAGYFQLAVNVVYSFVSIPLILYYLPKAEFGLWATLIQLMSYLALVDLGMNSAAARLLVDHKDNRADGGYGSLLKTSFVVSAAQGLIVLLTVVLAAPALASLMKVPAEQAPTFITLMRWQGLLTVTGFCLRPLGMMLYAHQREYVVTLTGTLSLVVSLVLLWLGLAGGHGIYSFIYAGVLGAILTPVCLYWNCRKFDLLPRSGEWGKASRKIFCEVFAYGKDVFLMNLGAQLQMASQTIVVSRCFGLEMAAVWAVGTKMFNLLLPLMTRPLGAAFPGFYEMWVRGEMERLKSRFREVVLLTACLGAFLSVSFALCNSLFVHVWTSGQIAWSPLNDVLLAIWLFTLSMQTTHCCFVNVTKQIGGMHYILFAEGCCFVVLATVFGYRWGIAGMVSVSIVCTLAFSYAYSLIRSVSCFRCGFFELAVDWVRPAFKLTLFFGIIGIFVWFVSRSLPVQVRLALHSLVAFAVGGILFVRWGIPPEFMRKVCAALPRPVGKLLQAIAC